MRRRPMLSSCSSDREWRRIWWPWQEKWRSSGQSSLTQKSDSVWIHQQASWVGPQIEASNEVTFTGMYCLHCLFSTPSDISRRLSILVYSPFEFLYLFLWTAVSQYNGTYAAPEVAYNTIQQPGYTDNYAMHAAHTAHMHMYDRGERYEQAESRDKAPVTFGIPACLVQPVDAVPLPGVSLSNGS